MVYTSGPAPVAITASQIVKIVKSGNVDTVYFTTVSGGTYTLVGTNTLTVARTNWPALGSSIPGNGLTNFIQRTSSAATWYYSVRAQ